MSEQPSVAYGPGSFVWSELNTRDVNTAKTFYGRLLGWRFEPWGPPGAYWMIKSGEKTAGGVMDINKPEFSQAPECWSYYIDVDDVDASAGRVEKLGGTVVVPPTDIPEVGRFAGIVDPAGGHVCIMTLREHATAPPKPGPGEFLWVELLSRDFAKAAAFFGELLGWRSVDMPMPNGRYTLFQSKGANVGGGLQMPAQVPAEVPSHWVGYVHVADIDASIDVVKQAGGHVLFPVMDVPNVGRFTQLRDPSGAVVALMTPARM